MLSMIIVSGAISTTVHFSTTIMCRDGMVVYVSMYATSYMWRNCEMPYTCGYFKAKDQYCIIFHVS